MTFQYKREVEYRTENFDKQLRLISNRIVDAYENNVELTPYFVFLERYYENSSYEDILVSVYNESGELLYSIGDPLEFSSRDLYKSTTVIKDSDQQIFALAAQKSTDGKLIVRAAMPYTFSVAEGLHIDTVGFWFTLLVSTLSTALLIYFLTWYLMKNIRLLNEFAKNANNKDMRFDESKLSHDELGDISREIIKLYRDRGKALERNQREHEIAIHAIEEKSRMKRQLTNNINHELKTPVGVIRGYLETVLDSKDMDDNMREYFLRRAYDNVIRLCNLLNDVSAMTRLEEGSGKIPTTEVNFHDLVFTIENDFEQAGTFGDFSFEFNIPLDCNIKGNTNLITSTISNLIKNAVLHSHGTKIGLDMISESEKFYTFAFWDDGTGVDEVHLPHIFERFYRIDAGRSRKSGGTGLGLPIVKSTIEALGGTILVHNRSKGGLEFVFTFPKWTSSHSLSDYHA